MSWNWESNGIISSFPKIIISVFALSICSALLFILLVNRPVYDDVFNILDVKAYAHNGVSVSTVRAQRNPPGPGSFIWMAVGVRLLGDGELRDARLGVLFSWVLLVIGMLVAAHYSRFSQLWYGALLSTLVFPNSLTATATLLTEGPALLFAILGTLVWTEAVSRPKVSSIGFALVILGGLGIGTAIISRQYYVALLPATAVLALYLLSQRASESKTLWLVSVTLSLIVAVIPLLLLVAVWKNISSPGIAMGTSYKTYHAGVGLNFLRPLVAAFCTGFYLIPLTFPVMRCVQSGRRWRVLLVAAIIGTAAVPFRTYLVNIGVLHSLLKCASRVPVAAIVAFGSLAILIAYNAIALGMLLWEKRQDVLKCPPVIVSLLTVLFFWGGQFRVGGNIPFYDRYVLQLAPFLGLIAFFLIPKVTLSRAVVLMGVYLLSQEMLWRHVFIK
jgi:hypothetical protein